MSDTKQLEIVDKQPSLQGFGKMTTVEVAITSSAIWFAQVLSMDDAQALVTRWNAFEPMVEALRESKNLMLSMGWAISQRPALRECYAKADAALKLAEEGK